MSLLVTNHDLIPRIPMQAMMSMEMIMTHLHDTMPAMRISMSLHSLLPFLTKRRHAEVLGCGFFSCLGAVRGMSRPQKSLDHNSLGTGGFFRVSLSF